MDVIYDTEASRNINRRKVIFGLSMGCALTLCSILIWVSSTPFETSSLTAVAENGTFHHVFNKTMCTFLKHFPISRNVVISLCMLNKHIRVDIRYFVHDEPTIQGIYLNELQWNGLLTLLPKIISILHDIKYKELEI